mgnify:CR=1 FL=1
MRVGIQTCFLLLLLTTLSVANSKADEAPPGVPRPQLEKDLADVNERITEAPSPEHHIRASLLFRLGRFKEAIADYDTAARLGRPHDEYSCWERGLAQYYAGDFKNGGEQFARYHRVGATDIENGLWYYLCVAEEEGVEKARTKFFDYPQKLRKPFPALLALYRGEGSAEAVLAEARLDTASPEELKTRLFYAHYYLGKYFEIMDETEQARTHIRTSLEYEIPHFMYACALLDAERLTPGTPKEKNDAS